MQIPGEVHHDTDTIGAVVAGTLLCLVLFNRSFVLSKDGQTSCQRPFLTNLLAAHCED